MRVLVTGGTGFVGRSIVEELLKRGDTIVAYGNRRRMKRHERVEQKRGGLFDPRSLHRAMEGCDAAIHLVGIIEEDPSLDVSFDRVHHQATRNMVDAATRAGVKRYLHMSALGTRPDAVSDYHRTKFAGEEYIRASQLGWTIFQPSIIHGPRGKFMQLEARWVFKKAPPYLFMPYFGAGALGLGGAGMLQPIYVEDMARAFVEALDNMNAIRKTYPIGGTQKLSWSQLHRAAAMAMRGKKRLVLPIPAWYGRMLANLLPSKWLPFNLDQVIMSQEDNTCDLSSFKQDFGWEPRPFEETLAIYAEQMKLPKPPAAPKPKAAVAAKQPSA